MATTTEISNNMIVAYSKKATVDMFKGGVLGKLLQLGVVTVNDDLTGAKRGTTVNLENVSILGGTGVGADENLQGNEAALIPGNQRMTVVEHCHAVKNPTELKEEFHETHLEWDGTAQDLLVGFKQSRKDTSVLQQAAGAYPLTLSVDGVTYSGASRLFVTGGNTVSAPSSTRIVRAGGAATDQALTSSDTMSIDLIDEAIKIYETTYPSTDPLSDGNLILLVSHEQGKSLIQENSGAFTLGNIALNQIAGGKDSQTVMKSGYSGNKSLALIGTYRNVVIYACKRVAKGVNSSSSASISTVQRAVLLGSNAIVFASKFGSPLGKDGKAVTRMSAQLEDHGRYRSTSIHTIDGCLKTQVNHFGTDTDAGVVVISTYGA